MDIVLLGHLAFMIFFVSISSFFRWKQPRKSNWFIGYRTPFSMKNADTWQEANEYSAKIQFKASIIFCLLSTASFFLIGGMSSFYVSSALLTILSVSVVPFTEIHLRKVFNRDGTRIR